MLTLKHLVDWLNANKISLRVKKKKTETVIFKPKQKKFKGDLKIKLCGNRLYSTESVKYLGVKIDAKLSWQYHVNDLPIKLNTANALLFRMRKYVSLKILASIYFGGFFLTPIHPTAVYFVFIDFYLSYSCLTCIQNCSTIQRILLLQKKAVTI